VKEQKQEHRVPHRSSGAVLGHGEGSHGVPRTTQKKLLLPLQTNLFQLVQACSQLLLCTRTYEIILASNFNSQLDVCQYPN
jgi:hypothetical protein